MQVQLSVSAEAAFPDAQQPGSCLEKQPGARKKQEKPVSFGIWDLPVALSSVEGTTLLRAV